MFRLTSSIDRRTQLVKNKETRTGPAHRCSFISARFEHYSMVVRGKCSFIQGYTRHGLSAKGVNLRTSNDTNPIRDGKAEHLSDWVRQFQCATYYNCSLMRTCTSFHISAVQQPSGVSLSAFLTKLSRSVSITPTASRLTIHKKCPPGWVPVTHKE